MYVKFIISLQISFSKYDPLRNTLLQKEERVGNSKDKYPQKEMRMPIEFYSKGPFVMPRMKQLVPNFNEGAGFEMVHEG